MCLSVTVATSNSVGGKKCRVVNAALIKQTVYMWPYDGGVTFSFSRAQNDIQGLGEMEQGRPNFGNAHDV